MAVAGRVGGRRAGTTIKQPFSNRAVGCETGEGQKAEAKKGKIFHKASVLGYCVSITLG